MSTVNGQQELDDLDDEFEMEHSESSTGQSSNDDDDFVLGVYTIPVHDEGLYRAYWTGIKRSERKKFGVARDKDIEKCAPNEKEPILVNEFTAVNAENPINADGSYNILKYKDDSGEMRDIVFNIKTSQQFMPNSKRAQSTKVFQGIIGRVVQPEEAKNLRVFRLQKELRCPVNLLVAIVDNDDGTQRNSITGIRRPKTMNGQPLPPIDLTPFLRQVPMEEGSPVTDQNSAEREASAVNGKSKAK